MSALLLLTGLLGGCQGDATGEPARERGSPIPARDRVECDGRCRVQLFNGFELREVAVGANGAVDVPTDGSVMVFVSAPGQVPQVRNVRQGKPLGVVHLLPSRPGLGYVAVAVVGTMTGGRRGGPLQALPLAGEALAVGPAHAVTDGEGGAVVALAPGSYEVVLAERRFPVEVPRDGTAVLPLVGRRMMVD